MKTTSSHFMKLWSLCLKFKIESFRPSWDIFGHILTHNHINLCANEGLFTIKKHLIVKCQYSSKKKSLREITYGVISSMLEIYSCCLKFWQPYSRIIWIHSPGCYFYLSAVLFEQTTCLVVRVGEASCIRIVSFSAILCSLENLLFGAEKLLMISLWTLSKKTTCYFVEHVE